MGTLRELGADSFYLGVRPGVRLTEATLPFVRLEHRKFYRPDIDGLRAVAIICVVLFHSGIPGFPGGFVGVDVFFVISGLLVGAHVYEDVRAGAFKLGRFYVRRAKRLLPALLVVVSACSLFAILLLSPAELVDFGKFSIATVLSGANLYAWRAANYFAPEASQNPLLSAWSLGLEEQFYWVFPLIVLFCSGLSRKAIFVGTAVAAFISLVCCIAATNNHLAAAFYLLPFRAWEFGAGFLIALDENRRNPAGMLRHKVLAEVLSIAGIAAILWSVHHLSKATIYPGYATLLPIAGSVALLLGSQSAFNRYILGSSSMAFLGRISYSVYLWHWPLLSFMRVVSDRPLSLGLTCAVEAVAIALAIASYFLIEGPFRRSSRSTASLALRYGLLSLAVAIPPALFVVSGGFPQRSRAEAQIDNVLATVPHSCWSEGALINSARECIDLKDTRPAIALIGDSHAEVLAGEIKTRAAQSGYKLYELVKSSCPPLQVVTTIHFTVASQVQCQRFNENVMKFLTQTPGIRLAILGGYWAGPQVDHQGYIANATDRQEPSDQLSEANFAAGLEGEIAGLQAAGIEVVLLRDVPGFRFQPVNRMRANATPLRRLLVGWLFPQMLESDSSAPVSDTYQEADSEIERQLDAATSAGVKIFDPKPNLCSSGRCRFATPPAPLYFDKHHVTPLGAAYALRNFDIDQLVSGPKAQNISE